MNGAASASGSGGPATARPVVLFDLDDTLMAHREAVAAGIALHMRERAYPGDLAAAQALWHELEERHYHAYLAGELTFEEQRRARATDFALAHGEPIDDEAAGDWFAEYFERYRASWALHDDVLPSLDALEGALPGVRFGIITNGEVEFQLAKLVRLGLEVGHPGRIAQLVASGAEGVAKPDRRIFEIAVERFAAEAPVSAAAYVGDRLRTDAIGAARAGLVGVWLNRPGSRPSEADAADAAAAGVHEIRTLAELPALLAHAMVVAEAAALTAAAAVVGVGLGVAYGWAGAQSLLGGVSGEALLIAPVMPWPVLVLVVIAAVVLTIVASLAPARRAARVSPVEALAVG